MKKLVLIPVLFLGACNFVNVKPNSMKPESVIFAQPGGWHMRHHAKEVLESRGHTVLVGRLIESGEDDISETTRRRVPASTQYSLRVMESTQNRHYFLRPIWCLFNGFWWWNFNMSITSQESGAEILSWTGRGCANSSIRRFDRLLAEMEINPLSFKERGGL